MNTSGLNKINCFFIEPNMPSVEAFTVSTVQYLSLWDVINIA
jgi:hypothetical protein